MKKIIGVTVGTTMPRANLEQDNPKKADYVRGKEALDAKISAIEEAVAGIQADLAYVAIDITGISCPQAGVHELGEVVEAVTVSWSLNKEPASQVLNGQEVDTAVRSMELTGLSVSSAKTYILVVTDERDANDKASVSLSFCNGVYYGVLEDGVTIDSAAILALTRKLQSSKGLTFTATASETQRHVYAIPTRYGTPAFKDAETGFQAGFYLAETIAFTNASGYTENYDVWLSNNPGLGSMTVAVS